MIGFIQKIGNKSGLIPAAESETDEFDLVLRIGDFAYAGHHFVVASRVRLWRVLMFARHFVETFPIGDIVVVTGVVFDAVLVGESASSVPRYLIEVVTFSF